MSKKTKATVAITLLASSVYLSGCGLFGGGKLDKIDPPPKVTSLSKGESLDEGSKNKLTAAEKENSIMTELYLIDKNGYVVSQTLPLPNEKGIATKALEYLVVDGPVQDMIPNGFRAVIPANTNISVNVVKDGTAIVDFSKDFKNYDKKDEEKILQSITWTLTQFDSIKKVQLQVNGHPLNEMPVNDTPINPDGLTRADGINNDFSDVIDITNTHALTVYYLADNAKYFVPVTKRVSNTETNDAKAIINELVKGPDQRSTLVSAFNPDVALLNDPVIQEGKVTLNFNENILGGFEEKIISDNVLKPLVYSLTEQKGIKSVAVEVNGSTKLLDENGKPLTEPVTRPEKVNTGSF
ncbi:GerMN domain-containing protein [Heyndrickxia sp. NPDC080065]|uniref:GerMN domain-containing protein n=1 Tax=Heyndrickxia sp. NPDC080065 TaxID=3390568 RepID=UPI003D027FD8